MRLRVPALLLVAGATIAAVAVIRPGRDREPPPPVSADEGEPPLPVSVIELRPSPLQERLATTGTIQASEHVDLVSEINGVVRSILFSEGEPVQAGTLLVKLDDEELQAQRERVRYRLHLAELREERQRELRQEGVVSPQEYDLASSELSVLRAELRLVEAQLQKTEIRAPFDGVVGLRQVSEGSLLSPQTRIATLQDLQTVKIDFTLPEAYADRIHDGDEVEFAVRGVDRRFLAEVFAVEPRIDPETRSLTVRARSPNPDRRLLPGAFADVTLAVREVPDALVVPSLAVVPELGGKKVFVVVDGKAEVRRIETGIRTDAAVQVTKGLEAGDRVIVSAIQRLRSGLAVEPRPAEPESAPTAR